LPGISDWRDALLRCGSSSGARSVSANSARFAAVRPHAERPNERRTTTRTASARASEPREPSRDHGSRHTRTRACEPFAGGEPGLRRRWTGVGRAQTARWIRRRRGMFAVVRAEAVVVGDAVRLAVRVCFQRSFGRSRAGERAPSAGVSRW